MVLSAGIRPRLLRQVVQLSVTQQVSEAASYRCDLGLRCERCNGWNGGRHFEVIKHVLIRMYTTWLGQVWLMTVLFFSKNVLIRSSVWLCLCWAAWHGNHWTLGAVSSVGLYGDSEIQAASQVHLFGLMNLSLPLFPQE